MVVKAGVAIVGLPFTLLTEPGDQVKVEAPKAFKVDVLPAQIVNGLPVVVIVGVATTVKVTVVKLEQPKALFPETLYIVVTLGFAFTTEPVAELREVNGDQV